MKKMKKGFTLVELMIVVAIIGILSAIAIPNFMRFQARSKQAEVKTNLKAIFTGQKARFGERDRYSVALGEIGFAPERGNRYSYDLGVRTAYTAAAAPGTYVCQSMESRAAALAAPGGGVDGDCGVLADVYRYGATVVPANVTSRASVTWILTTTGNAAIPPDNIGVIQANCPTCEFAAQAMGNVDNDQSGDQWFVSSQFGRIATGTACAEADVAAQGQAPGSPINTYNDVNCNE